MEGTSLFNVELRGYAPQVQVHSHDFFQMVLPVHGRLDIEIAGRPGLVDHGAIAVIGAGERHAFEASSETNQFLVLDLPEELLASTSLGRLTQMSVRRFLPLSPAATHLVAYWEQTIRSSAPAGREDYRLSIWLDLLLETLARESRSYDDRPSRALARAMAFIERNYSRSISVRDVAREAALGVSRLHELFQQRLRITPREYLSEVRLRHAMSLIAGGLHSIAEIAVRTGHADQSTLTRSMRRTYGITPGKYRRNFGCSVGASAQSSGRFAKNRRSH
jgi:AraC-like DNA-binding protein